MQGSTIAWVAIAGLVVCAVIALVVRTTARGEHFFTSRGGRDEATTDEAASAAAGTGE
jgi:hypothetical protein